MVTMDKTMRLSSTVMEVWRLRDNGVTSLTFWGHVTWWRQLHGWCCRLRYLRCEKKETKKQLKEYKKIMRTRSTLDWSQSKIFLVENMHYAYGDFKAV